MFLAAYLIYLNCLISSRDHVKIFGLSAIFGKVISFVIPMVGTLAVHVAFSISGAVPLPVVASCVVAAIAFIALALPRPVSLLWWGLVLSLSRLRSSVALPSVALQIFPLPFLGH